LNKFLSIQQFGVFMKLFAALVLLVLQLTACGGADPANSVDSKDKSIDKKMAFEAPPAPGTKN
jgi:hypothetical protein